MFKLLCYRATIVLVNNSNYSGRVHWLVTFVGYSPLALIVKILLVEEMVVLVV